MASSSAIPKCCIEKCDPVTGGHCFREACVKPCENKCASTNPPQCDETHVVDGKSCIQTCVAKGIPRNTCVERCDYLK